YDIWSLIFFLDQGASLGRDFAPFKSALDLSNDLLTDEERRETYEKSLTTLFEKIRDFAIRETKRSTRITLPTKTIENILVEPEDRQREIYRSYRDDLRAIVVKRGVPRLDEA